VRTLDEALGALEARAPHYLISAVPPTTAQCPRLLALTEPAHAVAVCSMVAREILGASWTWEVTAEGRLLAGVLGLDVEAQLLPDWPQDAVLAHSTWYRPNCSRDATRTTTPGSRSTAWSTKSRPASQTLRTGWPRSG
jgi:hypothetical protein